MRAFDVLREPDYRRFAGGQIVSLVGTWIQRIAQDWLVLQLSGNSPVALGVASGLQFGPSLLAPWGGIVADRYDRRRLLICTSAVLGAGAAILGLLTLRGAVTLTTVYVLCGVSGLAVAVESPVRHAFVPRLVPREVLPNAIAANSAMFSIAKVVGPAIAGILIGHFGLGWAFLANAASFVAVIFGLCRIGSPASDSGRHRPVDRRDGFRRLRDSRDLLMVLVLVAWASTVGFTFAITLPIFVRSTFHGGPTSYGLLTTIGACGAVLGTSIAASRSGTPPVRYLLIAALAFGAVEVLVGFAPTYVIAALLLVPAGFLTVTVTTSANSILQESTPDEQRGWVMGLYSVALQGGAPFGDPMVGLFAQWWGPRAPIIIGGVCVLVAASICIFVVTHRDG